MSEIQSQNHKQMTRYGINIYVVIYMYTYYILKYIVYKGRDMVYSSTTNYKDKNMTQVVK